MNTSAHSHRLVSGLAVTTVVLAALGAAAASWVARSMGEAPDAQPVFVSEPPAADAPVTVVKAPLDDAAPSQPVMLKECAGWRASESSL